MSLRFELPTLGLVLSLAITAAVGALASRHVSSLEETERWISHTHEVLETTQAVVIGLGEADRARRTYTVSRDEAELVPYRDALARLDASRRSLVALTADDPAQRERVAEAVAVIDARLEQLAQAVSESHLKAFDAEREARLTTAGIALTGRLGALATALTADERQLLVERQAAAHERSALVKRTILLGFGSSSGLLLAAFLLLRRESIRRARSEEALAEREQRLAITLGSIGDAVIATDARGRITHLNQVGEQLTGWPLAEALGKHHQEIFRIIDDKTREPAADVIARVLTERQRVELSTDTSIIARDGTRRPIADSAAPILDAAGKLQGVVIVFRDVSGTRAVEARFRNLVEAAPDAILIADEAGRIEVVNEQASRLFGYGPEELIGMAVERLLPEAQRARHLEHRHAYQQAPAKRAMGSGLQLLARRKDGTTCPVEISLAPLHTGEGNRVIAAVRDVTQRRELERFRDEYVGYISHDLKNPLSVIALQARLLTRLQAGAAAPEEAHAVRVIAESAIFIDKLVRELLEMAYVESDHLVLRTEPVELGELLRGILERDVLVSDRARVQLEVLETSTVLAEASRLERVVVNFIQNAIKYSPPGSAIQVRLEVRGASAVLSVIDQGPGVPPEERGEVFGKYRRLASARGKEGLGLGLYISSKIIEAHHGQIGVSGAPGEGATFFVRLPTVPAVPRVASAAVPPATAHDPAKRTKVLLVDDEVNAIRALSVLLGDEGLEVTSATNGEKALTLAALERPDIVVLDVQMPEMSGLTLLELLREKHPGLPAVIMSGHLEQHAGIARARLNTGAAYIGKPIDVDELVRTIVRLVPSGRVS